MRYHGDVSRLHTNLRKGADVLQVAFNHSPSDIRCCPLRNLSRCDMTCFRFRVDPFVCGI